MKSTGNEEENYDIYGEGADVDIKTNQPHG